MALIRIEHEDFDLQVSCGNFDAIYAEAAQNIVSEALWATYKCSPDASPMFCTNDADAGVSLGKRVFFFDNADYGVFIKTKNGASLPRPAFVSDAMNNRMQSFGKDIITGTVNFGNDIGKFDISFTYRKGAADRKFTFTIEILSRKLDYHHDWAELVKEIEEEHQTLALDFLRETYHSFDAVSKEVPKDQTADMIWWCLFKSYQDQFIKACRFILNRPRHKWCRQAEYLRADQLRMPTPLQENEYAEFRRDTSRLYYSERTVNDKDTPENRFLKMAVERVCDKYGELSRYLLDQKSISETAKEEIRQMSLELKSIRRNAFFRGIGRFKGLRQESLILQRASGYSTVYRIWAVLKMMYSLGGDRMRLESKDIAALYEMWCFIRVKNAVASLTEISEKAKANLKDYVYRLFTGEKSRVVFKDDSGIELAEVSYNSSTNAGSGDGIADTVAPTTSIAPGSSSEERPDIVLRLTKNFGGDNHYKVTYLFDAKYRIQGRYASGESVGVDYPPQDAIDQMHRYRDAIYYRKDRPNSELTNEPLKKEIVGGYVLFPGTGKKDAIAAAPFMQTREEVNIGAFPLRPGNDENNKILREFLEDLLNHNAWIKHLEDVIAQKGMVQVKLEDAKISEEQIYSRPGRTVVAEAKWILTHKAVLVPVKDLPISETVKKIKFVNFYWEPPVTLSVGAKGYLGVLTAKEIETKFSKVEFSKESLFHVFCGQLMNAGAMSEYVNKKSKGASDER